jgi:hypothetical protein
MFCNFNLVSHVIFLLTENGRGAGLRARLAHIFPGTIAGVMELTGSIIDILVHKRYSDRWCRVFDHPKSRFPFVELLFLEDESLLVRYHEGNNDCNHNDGSDDATSDGATVG